MVMWILHNGLEGNRSSYLLMLGCRVKPEAVSRLYWNKGPCEAELSIGPNLVKLVAKGFIECKDLLEVFIYLLFPMIPTKYHEENEGRHFEKCKCPQDIT